MARKKSRALSLWELLDQRIELERVDRLYLEKLKKGYAGECQVDDLIEKMIRVWGELTDSPGDSPFVLYKDINIDIGGHSQLDSVILTGKRLIILEIKNYNYAFVYRNSIAYGKEGPLGYDITTQVQRAKQKMEVIIQRNNLPLEVQSCLIFVNNNYQPDVDDSCPVPCYTLEDLPLLFQDWIKDEAPAIRTIQKFNQALNQYAFEGAYVENLNWQEKYDKKVFRLGIPCHECGAFDLTFSRYYAYCRHCGTREKKGAAARRIIDEYAQIFWNDSLTSSAIQYFCQEELYYRLIVNTLNKHYQLLKAGKPNQYLNNYNVG